jgi:hypothetical protein
MYSHSQQAAAACVDWCVLQAVAAGRAVQGRVPSSSLVSALRILVVALRSGKALAAGDAILGPKIVLLSSFDAAAGCRVTCSRWATGGYSRCLWQSTCACPWGGTGAIVP